MKSILTQLYYGELSPASRHTSVLEEYQKKFGEYIRCQDNFTEELNQINPALGKRFTKIMEEACNNVRIEYSAAFVEGFQMGARMMLEICQENG